MDLSSIMQQARDMHEKMAKIQNELANKTITGSAGGGMVNVEATGRGDIISVKIEPELINPAEATMLQDLVTAAVNDALRKARELAKQEMTRLTGGIQIPGVTNLF
ncbi:YbaB/EbfC family nucleoid-associated protein [Desulfofustis limnaeus]|jgi:DNA-binding YbaB/EbfC family protein|uniref:Nucleoid-associated protein DPPLL_20900 n=1 Tax=Desulfofustis limnaeus TaxID=2740163 RepID=A0ABN6M4E9_9BACT|nr:YbaB/EbfC family nucleoid-associated protein [Desulfofustis limnaeus]MDX9896467.1 YbaB/EbfC family nucleoid-associated protein [Desulfofustis sp.]BDD87725.1 nucleoid-associated protein [Desulfofustis limnaeus]